MKVQKIVSDSNDVHYILLNDEYEKVEEVVRYTKHLEALKKSPITIQDYLRPIQYFYQYIQIKYGMSVIDLLNAKNLPPLEILEGYLNWLLAAGYRKVSSIDKAQSIANTSVNYYMNIVLGYLRFLVSENMIVDIPVLTQNTNRDLKSFLSEMHASRISVRKNPVKLPEAPRNRPFVTREQYNQVFQACSNLRDQLIVAFMFECALRLEDVLGLHIEDVAAIEEHSLHITARFNPENNTGSKRNKEATLFYPEYMGYMLVDYITEILADYDTDFLFINLHGENKGQPMQRDTVEKLFSRLENKVGFHVTPHALRRGFATERRQKGMQESLIRDLMRHQSFDTTMMYIQSSPDELRKASESILNENDNARYKEWIKSGV